MGLRFLHGTYFLKKYNNNKTAAAKDL